jgi:hypothetical protein
VTSPKLPIPASGEIMMVMAATNEEPKMTPTRVVVKTWDKYRLRETLMAGIALVFFYISYLGLKLIAETFVISRLWAFGSRPVESRDVSHT